MALRSSTAGKFFGGIVGKGDKYINPGGMKEGFVGDAARGAFNWASASPKRSALAVGGLAGAAGGMLSSDRDMHWYSGGAMGAFTGAQLATRGLSKLGIGGAAAGAAYGAFSENTSIMGGAMMGASLGAARRYGKLGIGSFKSAAPERTAGLRKMMGSKKPGMGRMRRAGFGANAVSRAISRDVGFGWRAGGGKATGGRAGPASNKAYQSRADTGIYGSGTRMGR